jgi:molybdopterin-guanine dinucleotide biosynthesis protein B
MNIFGITGHSGMGKTTLLEKLIPELRSRGLTVSLIKHSHKDIEVDRPGKDSYRLRESGCTEVMLLGAQPLGTDARVVRRHRTTTGVPAGTSSNV